MRRRRIRKCCNAKIHEYENTKIAKTPNCENATIRQHRNTKETPPEHHQDTTAHKSWPNSMAGWLVGWLMAGTLVIITFCVSLLHEAIISCGAAALICIIFAYALTMLLFFFYHCYIQHNCLLEGISSQLSKGHFGKLAEAQLHVGPAWSVSSCTRAHVANPPS